MLSKWIIKLALVVGLFVPTLVAGAIPSSGGPLWSALGVPMQANGLLLERSSYSSFWVWHDVDREHRLKEEWTKKYGAKEPKSNHRSFVDDLSLEQFR